VTKLTEEIRKQGLYCKTCNEPMESTAISEKEAQDILKLIKGVFIEAIREKIFRYPNCNESRTRNDIMREAIKAIEDIN
jgi:hypothetical protein